MSTIGREAVLLLAFNRPDSLERVIAATRAARPPRVYLAVDGPRPGRGDEAAVRACQDLAGAIDWGADVRTLFRDTNLGCGRGVSSALSWFFEDEERGIVVEDDVMPSAEFFSFIEWALDRFAADPRVFSAAGSTFVPRRHLLQKGPVRFSRYPYVWGWGTWRRSWSGYRYELGDWRSELPLRALWERTGRSMRATTYWRMRFDQQADASVDTWDFQLTYSALRAAALTVVANVNLTENIGFDGRATHTTRKPNFALDDTQGWSVPSEDVPVIPDGSADSWSLINQFGATVPRMGYRWATGR